MLLKRLSLTNFRIFSRLDLEFPSRVVLLSGGNAQGKTTILEAVAFLANFNSFNASAERQLLSFNLEPAQVQVGRILGEFSRQGRNHTLEVRLIQEFNGNTATPRFRKEVLYDGVKKPLGELYGKFNAVLFLPQMSRIIEGGPVERRTYLDEILSQVEYGYSRHLSDYNKALSQRNALLKILGEQGGDVKQLEIWDGIIARHGAELMRSRIKAMDELDTLARPIHQKLTQDAEVLRFSYQPSFEPAPSPKGQMQLVETIKDRVSIPIEEIEEGFRKGLKSAYREDIGRGATSLGPHRDEFRFLSNQVDLGIYGSRGQCRTALLAMKLAEVEWMRARTGDWPVLLLDEFLAELDPQRRESLLSVLGDAEQALLTSADTEMFLEDFVKTHQVWVVKDGLVRPSSAA